MLQFSNFAALHMHLILNTYYTTYNKHCYEVDKQWCIISYKSTAAIFSSY